MLVGFIIRIHLLPLLVKASRLPGFSQLFLIQPTTKLDSSCQSRRVQSKTYQLLLIDWVGLGWFGLGWFGLGWVGLGWFGLGLGLGWVGLGWVGFGLGWVGLGWVGLGLVWIGLFCCQHWSDWWGSLTLHQLWMTGLLQLDPNFMAKYM